MPDPTPPEPTPDLETLLQAAEAANAALKARLVDSEKKVPTPDQLRRLASLSA